MSDDPGPASEALPGNKLADGVEFIQPPSTLKTMTSAPGGITPEQAINAAQKRIESMSVDYLGWARAEFAAVERIVAEASGVNKPMDLKVLFQRVHDIKGQGGTFGYPLVTDVAHSFCRTIEAMMAVGETHVELVRLHVDALKLIFGSEIKGPGGADERRMVDGINRAREKYAQRVKVA